MLKNHGECDAAREQLETAAELAPDNGDIQDALNENCAEPHERMSDDAYTKPPSIIKTNPIEG